MSIKRMNDCRAAREIRRHPVFQLVLLRQLVFSPSPSPLTWRAATFSSDLVSPRADPHHRICRLVSPHKTNRHVFHGQRVLDWNQPVSWVRHFCERRIALILLVSSFHQHALGTRLQYLARRLHAPTPTRLHLHPLLRKEYTQRLGYRQRHETDVWVKRWTNILSLFLFGHLCCVDGWADGFSVCVCASTH